MDRKMGPLEVERRVGMFEETVRRQERRAALLGAVVALTLFAGLVAAVLVGYL